MKPQSALCGTAAFTRLATVLLFAICALCGFTRSVSAAQKSWDATADLTLNEVPNGNANQATNPNASVPEWSYGYRGTYASSELSLFSAPGDHITEVTAPDVTFGGWARTTNYYPNVRDAIIGVAGSGTQYGYGIFLHPDYGSTGATYAVVRWTAPHAGTFDVSAYWQHVDLSGPSDGVDAHLVWNGSSIYDAAIAYGGSSSTLQTLALKEGDTLDFTLGPGANGIRHYDTTNFLATITETGTTPAFPNPNPYVEFVASGDQLVGDSIPEAVLDALGSPATNVDGDVAYRARLKLGRGGVVVGTDRAIFRDSADKRTLVARSGTKLPGTGKRRFLDFRSPVINAKGDVAFIGSVTGETPDASGIWMFHNGVLRTVACTWAPATVGAESFAEFQQIVLPDNGGPVFLAKLRGKESATGIWADNGDGTGTLVALTGRRFPLTDPNGKFVASIEGLDGTAQTRSVSAVGDVVFRVTYANGATEIVRYVRN